VPLLLLLLEGKVRCKGALVVVVKTGVLKELILLLLLLLVLLLGFMVDWCCKNLIPACRTLMCRTAGVFNAACCLQNWLGSTCRTARHDTAG
jgi:hypothetical protein